MPARGLFDIRFTLLEKVMDLSSFRHDAIASNLSNANTPGYIAKDVAFEQKLRAILDERDSPPLALTDPSHLPVPFAPATLEHADGDTRPILDLAAGNDLNTVDIDRETSELAKNQVLYLANGDMLRRKFAYLRYSIQEGR
jgi:flagellar basal-body rod protein FlgB